MNYILTTQNVTKQFKNTVAVNRVNLRIKKGEIYGLLGPNGSGKTTLMKMMMNLLKPTQGSINIFGEPLHPTSYEPLKRIGAIIEYPIFYDKLSAMENLELHCQYMGYHNKNDIREALEMVNLKNIENKKVKEFSLGMKQRLAIARAIITKPELLILDEPINGLDPLGIIEIRDLLKKLNQEYGITILISSHILSEIEHVADTIGILKQGQLLEETSIEDLRKNNNEYFEIVTPQIEKLAYLLTEKMNIHNFKTLNPDTIRIYETPINQGELFTYCMNENIYLESFSRKAGTLEEYFLSLVQGSY